MYGVCETLSGYCVYCRVLHRLDKLVKSVTAEAVDVTQVVCSAQNVVRRKFVSDLKRSMSDVLQVKKDWQQLIVQLTHQRSVSFSSLSLHHYCTSVTHASHLPLLPNTWCPCIRIFNLNPICDIHMSLVINFSDTLLRLSIRCCNNNNN